MNTGEVNLSTLSAKGLIALVVDGGRHGYGHLGVPVSGAFHPYSYEDACFLAGILSGSAAIEMHHGVWEFTSPVATTLGLSGEGLTVTVDGSNLGSGHSIQVPAYAFVKVSRSGGNYRGPAYIAIAGLAPEPTLGSASSDTFSGLGPAMLSDFSSFPMEKTLLKNDEFRFLQPARRPNGRLYFSPGPWDTGENEFSVSVESVSRSGVRFSTVDNPLIHGDSATVASFPVFPGAIQLPPNNAPIVLGPDAGATGGYPVIGVIDTPGLVRLSECLPGDTVTFSKSSNENNSFKRPSRHIVN